MTFVLNLVTGTTYAFSLVLIFILIIPLILFNILNLHLKKCNNKYLICLAENMWLILSFFWLFNIWACSKYQ
jgi:hypothetical protein